MEGLLFKYGPNACHTAFLSARQHRRHVIVLGGLTDGLLPTAYVPALAARCDQQGWAMVQALLSSSYLQFGLSSLDRDAEEVHKLACCLQREHGSTGIVLVGHSTGCQDGVRYAQRFRRGAGAPPLLGVVLQAPVSDREYFGTLPGAAEALARAEAMLTEGRGEEIACRHDDFGGAPLTARRFHSLVGRGGDDDMFSSDLPAEQMQQIFEPLRGLPTLVLQSGADEYIPQPPDPRALGRRIADAIGGSAALHVVQGGRHALEGHVEEAVEAIGGFLASLE